MTSFRGWALAVEGDQIRDPRSVAALDVRQPVRPVGWKEVGARGTLQAASCVTVMPEGIAEQARAEAVERPGGEVEATKDQQVAAVQHRKHGTWIQRLTVT